MTLARTATSRLRTVWALIKETFSEWQKDKAPRLGAALSFYTILSLAPLLIIAIAFASFFFEGEAVRGHITTELQGLLGKEGARLIESMIKSASEPAKGVIASAMAIATLLLGATGVFVQLQDALNTAWGIETPGGSGILHMLRSRFLSFVSVLGVGFLLLVSLILNTVLTAAAKYVGGWLPEQVLIAETAHFLISFGGITLLFAMMYKLLPDAKIAWRDVWIGAIVTALLFTIGKFLIGLYLGRNGMASAYGAAGTTVVVLLWVYYAAQTFLLGAEFTYVYATRCGSRCKATDDKAHGRAESRERQEKTPDPVPFPGPVDVVGHSR